MNRVEMFSNLFYYASIDRKQDELMKLKAETFTSNPRPSSACCNFPLPYSQVHLVNSPPAVIRQFHTKPPQARLDVANSKTDFRRLSPEYKDPGNGPSYP